MSDISDILQRILTTRYGRDMRQSFYDGLLACHTDANQYADEIHTALQTTDQATSNANTAAQTANTATQNIQNAWETIQGDIDTAIDDAEDATQNANQAAQEARQAISSQVSGVKGDKEENYRSGNVNLTPANIGAVADDGDVAENILGFTSVDPGPESEEHEIDYALYEMPQITSGLKLKNMGNYISRFVNNLRWALKLLGTSDLTGIGDGTVTGAISEINA
ncbi:MAG: hypothetical protein IJ079_03935, partial [Lachnospiraceae bacterium]|nr:hypothetical protein [Lachnospiraceae bacterium]MBR1568715.1 hypothetical protein [Lachnospiraceae bacterium]